MRTQLIEMLDDTLNILQQGFYNVNWRRIRLKLTHEQMRSSWVFLPDDVTSICLRTDFVPRRDPSPCRFTCVNMDSYSLARLRYRECRTQLAKDDVQRILVLNLANPVNPGGGVRGGARAQEEDLCRKSSLLLSLESFGASTYYRYNRSLHTNMGSDAIILTPEVEIIKDEHGRLLDHSVIVSVMTCAAPMLTFGLEGMSDEQYEALMLRRIVGMLKCAAFWRYRHLVLGAFGCGAFANDARTVAALFRKAFDELECAGLHTNDLFRQIDFGVLCQPAKTYNYDAFRHYFGT